MTLNQVKQLADTCNRLGIFLGDGKVLRVTKATLIEDAHPRLVLEDSLNRMVVTMTERTEIQEMEGDAGWVLLDEDGECWGVLDIL